MSSPNKCMVLWETEVEQPGISESVQFNPMNSGHVCGDLCPIAISLKKRFFGY